MASTPIRPLGIGDRLLHIADEFPEMGVLAPTVNWRHAGGVGPRRGDAEAVFAQVVAAGAAIRPPLVDMLWGDRHGQLEDPCGHRWNIAQRLRDVPYDEVAAAAARAFS